MFITRYYNLEAIIIHQPKSFSKIFKASDNTYLELTEFEKLYNVNANDQILIGKFLKPKVIENLINLAYADEKKPKIAIFNQKVTLVFESIKVSGWNDPKSRITGVNFKGKVDHMASIICQNVKFNLDLLLYSLKWVEAFEFI